jgi:hypothetical protein
MNIGVIVDEILRFYRANPRVDHFMALLQGPISTWASIVVLDKAKVQRRLPAGHSRHLISLAEIEDGILRRSEILGFPLVFDAEVLIFLFQGLSSQQSAPSPAPKPRKKKVKE